MLKRVFMERARSEREIELWECVRVTGLENR